jgi:hypothetical protein
VELERLGVGDFLADMASAFVAVGFVGQGIKPGTQVGSNG